MVRDGHVMKKPKTAGIAISEQTHGTIATFLVSDFKKYATRDPTIVPNPPAGIAKEMNTRRVIVLHSLYSTRLTDSTGQQTSSRGRNVKY